MFLTLVVLGAAAFLVVAVTVTIAVESVRRARALADSHAVELGSLNAEIRRLTRRASSLLEVTTALSEAKSVDERESRS